MDARNLLTKRGETTRTRLIGMATADVVVEADAADRIPAAGEADDLNRAAVQVPVAAVAARSWPESLADNICGSLRSIQAQFSQPRCLRWRCARFAEYCKLYGSRRPVRSRANLAHRSASVATCQTICRRLDARAIQKGRSFMLPADVPWTCIRHGFRQSTELLLTVGKITGRSCNAPQHDRAHGGVDHRHCGLGLPVIVTIMWLDRESRMMGSRRDGAQQTTEGSWEDVNPANRCSSPQRQA
jgi:hypothetical protein